ncbi:MAG: hypothetical protein JWN95_4125 [Frankiales bacterium]|nr:hypothetical protein [Frankiales bacterium]
MSTTIGVGVDGSTAGTAALLWAARECRVRNAELVVVHAAVEGERSSADDRAHLVPEPNRQAGERLVQDQLRQAGVNAAEIKVSTVISDIPVVDALVTLSLIADLIVIGTRGRRDLERSMLGSVAHRLAVAAHCPVAVIPPLTSGSPSTAPIVVGMSGSVAGRLALAEAFAEANRRSVTLVAVSVLGRSTDGGGHIAVPDSGFAELMRDHPGVEVDYRARPGEPADVLLDAAGGAQLIVVGCRQAQQRWQTRLGPVCAAVLHYAPCPVLLVGSSLAVIPVAVSPVLSRAGRS